MEWTVFQVVAALAALFLSLGVPIIQLNGAITRLNVTLERTEKDVRQKEAARDSHRRLWAHCEEQDAALQDHDRRITLLEERRKP